MGVTVRVSIDRNRVPALELMDWKPAFEQIASYFTAEMAEMFDTAGASRGHKWQELAASTLVRKARTGKSTEPLQSRGHLRASFRRLRLNQRELVYGTDIAYAKYHDSDGPRKLGRDGKPVLPQRKLLRIIPRDLEAIRSVFIERIVETGGGA